MVAKKQGFWGQIEGFASCERMSKYRFKNVWLQVNLEAAGMSTVGVTNPNRELVVQQSDIRTGIWVYGSEPGYESACARSQKS